MSELVYREVEGMPDAALLLELSTLAKAITEEEGGREIELNNYAENFRVGLTGHPWIYTCLAYGEDRLVGYKVGRSNDPRAFESWKGGVLTAFRRKGIAGELARRQAAWCRTHPFQVIFTETAPDNAPMLILNLRQGFTISGTYLKRNTTLMARLVKVLHPEQ